MCSQSKRSIEQVSCEGYSALGRSVVQHAVRQPDAHAGERPGNTPHKVFTHVRLGEATATARKVVPQLGQLLPCQVEEVA